MSRPVRIQLSRRGGFNLQRASLGLNGLPAVNVARPSKWGNPFHIGQRGMVNVRPDEVIREEVGSVPGAMVRLWVKGATKPGLPTVAFERPLTREDVISMYRGHLADNGLLPLIRTELRGKNLACWCKPGEACHADVLLELARGGE